MSSMCPVCSSPTWGSIDKRENVPILMNRLYPSRDKALVADRGTIDLVACETCGFAWNRKFDPALITYDGAYENDQSHSPAFLAHIEARADEIVASVPAGEGIDYLEVGCGQGGFLTLVAQRAGGRLQSAEGFDPAWRGGDQDRVDGARLHKVYFNPETARRLDRQPNVVASRHTIEHIPDPVPFLKTVRETLGPHSNARIFIETPCIAWIVKHRAMQDIFYEHCSIFTAGSLRYALEISGFHVEEVRHVFGGQYLWAVAQASNNTIREAAAGLGHAHPPSGTQAEYIARWRGTITAARANGPVAIWGAGAKGVTFALLIDPDGAILDHAIDINPGKQGLFLAGSGLPVLAPEHSAGRAPATIVVMNPNYLDEIRAKAASAGINARLVPID
jgi:cyclopropane fatty-acyl-phospholipid synthase-like methyltransferase